MNGIQKKPAIKLDLFRRRLGEIIALPDIDGEIFSDLYKDLFWQSYLISPERTGNGNPLNEMLLDWLSKSINYEEARQKAAGSLTSAIFQADALFNLIMSDEVIRDILKQAQEAQQQSQAQEQGQQQGQSQAQEQGKAAQNLKNYLNSAQADALRASVVKQADEMTEKKSALYRSWGQDGDNEEPIDLEKVLHDTNKLFSNRTFTQLQSLIGRMKGLVDSVKGKTLSEIGSHEVGLTQYFQDVFPSEWVAANNPAEKMEVIDNFLNYGLLGAIHRVGNRDGAKIIAVDHSGSMNGDTILIAKAVAYALAKVSEQNYYIFSFAGKRTTVDNLGNPLNFISSASWKDEEKKWLLLPAGGGTDFNLALEIALSKLSEVGEDNADIVIITDGQADITHETAAKYEQAKELHGVRLFVIVIQGSLTKKMKEIAYTIIQVNSLDDLCVETLTESIYNRRN